MTGIFRPALFLCALTISLFIPESASASRSYGVDNCSQTGCTEIKSERVRTYRTGQKARGVRHIRSRSVPGSLVPIKCGPQKIRVASTAASQFACFCGGLYPQYPFKAVGGWRPGKCWTGGKHPCGGAIDVEQSCRSKGPGHCLPRAFPVALTERLADKCGLQAGSRWGWRDVGHFETRGTLAGGNWKGAVQTASITGPLKFPVTHAESVKSQDRHPQEPMRAPSVVASADANDQHSMAQDDSDIAMPFVDAFEISPFNQPANYPKPPADPSPSRAKAEGAGLGFYAYNEINLVSPARLAMESLRDVPEGDCHQEVTRAAKLFDLDDVFLRALVKVESSCRPWEVTGSYIGLCQLSKFEFKRYGAGGDIKNGRANIIACAHKLTVEAVIFERATNTDISAARRYMIHQQGMEGAAEHYSQRDRVAVDSMCATREGQRKGRAWCIKAICLNTLPALRAACKSITSGQFIDHWAGKIEKFMAAGVGYITAKVQITKRYAKKYKTRYAHRKKHRIKYAAAR